jgi:hypothetical protein
VLLGGHSSRRDMPMTSRETVGTLAATAFSVLLTCCAPPAMAQESRPEPSPPARSDSGIPERLSRQLAPNPSALWRPPDLCSISMTRCPRSTAPPPRAGLSMGTETKRLAGGLRSIGSSWSQSIAWRRVS